MNTARVCPVDLSPIGNRKLIFDGIRKAPHDEAELLAQVWDHFLSIIQGFRSLRRGSDRWSRTKLRKEEIRRVKGEEPALPLLEA